MHRDDMSMTRRGLLAGLCCLVLLLLAAPATAAAEGGQSIATAPAVVYGQQQFGNTATGQSIKIGCSIGGTLYRSYWGLGVLAGDVVTINWEGMPGTHLRVMPIGTTDFNISDAEPAFSQEVSNTGKSQAMYTAPQAGVFPLYFDVCTSGTYHPPGPYDFLATVQHTLVVGISPITSIQTNSVISGTANLADGTPVPDGLVFTLNASWPSGSASYSAASAGGHLSFPLALPSSAQGQTVTLSLSRAADAGYLAAKSSEVKATVPLPPKPKHPRHLHCRRGFTKRKVHGKARCVRHRSPKRQHGGRYRARLSAVPMPASSECVAAGLARPQVDYAYMTHPGMAGQRTELSIVYPAMPTACHGLFRRIGQFQLRLQDGQDHQRWFTLDYWSSGGIYTKDHGGSGFKESLAIFPSQLWSRYRCTPGPGVTKVKLELRNQVKELSSGKLAGEQIVDAPVQVRGAC